MTPAPTEPRLVGSIFDEPDALPETLPAPPPMTLREAAELTRREWYAWTDDDTSYFPTQGFLDATGALIAAALAAAAPDPAIVEALAADLRQVRAELAEAKAELVERAKEIVMLRGGAT